MPTLTLNVHELHDRIEELPDVDDCYLIETRDSTGAISTDEEDGLYVAPFLASKMGVVESARAWARNKKDTWGKEHWGWDGTPEQAHFRMGCNSPTVSHPVTLTFQWGEGHPKTDGVEMLPHEPMKWAGTYCTWCHAEVGGKPSDCPERRLRAMSPFVTLGSMETVKHLKAIKLWHSKDPRVDD